MTMRTSTVLNEAMTDVHTAEPLDRDQQLDRIIKFIDLSADTQPRQGDATPGDLDVVSMMY